MTAEYELVFEQLNLSRRGRVLLEGFTAGVPAGAHWRSWARRAGKTTLLRTIAGLTPARQGRIARPAGRVAMVFQDPQDQFHVLHGGAPRQQPCYAPADASSPSTC